MYCLCAEQSPTQYHTNYWEVLATFHIEMKAKMLLSLLLSSVVKMMRNNIFQL